MHYCVVQRPASTEMNSMGCAIGLRRALLGCSDVVFAESANKAVMLQDRVHWLLGDNEVVYKEVVNQPWERDVSGMIGGFR